MRYAIVREPLSTLLRNHLFVKMCPLTHLLVDLGRLHDHFGTIDRGAIRLKAYAYKAFQSQAGIRRNP